MRKRKLFCEISPFTYKISAKKEILKRNLVDKLSNTNFADTKSDVLLPIVIKKHKSLIRRKLNNVDMQLQNNKAVNLSLAIPHITNILIKPNEVFSFWKLVGSVSRKKGYLDGVTISNGASKPGTGGGLCQFTNLIHWMILHTDLEIVEHHHHNSLDLFPDYKRQIPFGTGTSISYNRLDYRFKNTTDKTYQIIIYIDNEYLCGEIRSNKAMDIKVHIIEDEAYFYQKGLDIYRHNKIYRLVKRKYTQEVLDYTMILENHSKVMYDTSLIDKNKIISL